jgi:alpha,alpha-trehalase
VARVPSIALAIALRFATATGQSASTRGQGAVARRQDVARLTERIRANWRAFRRESRDLVESALDPKLRQSGTPPLYVPPAALLQVRRKVLRTLPAEARRSVRIEPLPVDPRAAVPAGLLYLPHPYVVSGTRFNEQYGWDSYFIVRGLLADGQVAAARAMTDNLLYEVDHYGKVLNANRVWSLGRSQPPFLSRMILDVYARTHDRAWLERAQRSAAAYHRYFTSGARRDRHTGLSRYVDAFSGPPPEVVGAGEGELERVRADFRAQPPARVARYYDARRDRLTARFFAGDRAMRASGFDSSDRFGPHGAEADQYLPVDLNSLLYQSECDLAEMARILGHPAEARAWQRRARARATAIRRYLWDPKRGMYFDYHRRTRRRSQYVFASTLFPLWARLASRKQAQRVVAQLGALEGPGGLYASATATGQQWDHPFVWAPLTAIAVDGLRSYGHHLAADRISVNFLSMVLKEFKAHGVIKEKYDGARRSADVSPILRYGYAENGDDFAWTGAVWLDLYRALAPAVRERVRNLDGEPPA